mgnify:CR=1 FL=1
MSIKIYTAIVLGMLASTGVKAEECLEFPKLVDPKGQPGSFQINQSNIYFCKNSGKITTQSNVNTDLEANGMFPWSKNYLSLSTDVCSPIVGTTQLSVNLEAIAPTAVEGVTMKIIDINSGITELEAMTSCGNASYSCYVGVTIDPLPTITSNVFEALAEKAATVRLKGSKEIRVTNPATNSCYTKIVKF